MYICSNCGTVFSDELIHRHDLEEPLSCPILSCEDGDLHEIDGSMSEVFIGLHQRGYFTRVCVAGHPRGIHEAIIVFSNRVEFSNLPNGFSYYRGELEDMITKKYNGNLAPPAMQKEIFKTIGDLLDWVESLPSF